MKAHNLNCPFFTFVGRSPHSLLLLLLHSPPQSFLPYLGPRIIPHLYLPTKGGNSPPHNSSSFQEDLHPYTHSLITEAQLGIRIFSKVTTFIPFASCKRHLCGPDDCLAPLLAFAGAGLSPIPSLTLAGSVLITSLPLTSSPRSTRSIASTWLYLLVLISSMSSTCRGTFPAIFLAFNVWIIDVNWEERRGI
jgi:hypothetical protein